MRCTPLIAMINKQGAGRERGRRRSINVFVLPYVHMYLRTLRRFNLGPGALGPPSCSKKAQGARRRNFSIRFPSEALINCGQFLKRRNEGTAAMHSSRAFLIGSRARRIFVHRRRRDVWFFYARYVLCKYSFFFSLSLSLVECNDLTANYKLKL